MTDARTTPAEPDTRPICSADGCSRREPCGPFCRDNGNLTPATPAPSTPADVGEVCKHLESYGIAAGKEIADLLARVARERDEARAQLNALRDDLAAATAALLAAEKAMDDGGLRSTPAHDAILAALGGEFDRAPTE